MESIEKGNESEPWGCEHCNSYGPCNCEEIIAQQEEYEEECVIDKPQLEKFIEKIIFLLIPCVSVSVCSLGDEWSVNIDGKLYHFTISDK